MAPFLPYQKQKQNARSLFTFGKACKQRHYQDGAMIDCCLTHAFILIMPSPICLIILHITIVIKKLKYQFRHITIILKR
jgi:hypothetical protein